MSIPCHGLKVLLGCVTGCLALAGPAGEETGAPPPFEGEIVKFEEGDRQQPLPAAPVLFVGSSSIRLWPELPAAFPAYPVLQRGFGGSHMSDLLHYFDRVVKRYRPSLAVVYEGDNDLAAGKSVAAVWADFERFLERMGQELPGAEVMLIAVKPSPSRLRFLEAQRELNARMEARARQHPRVWFVDVFHPMLGADGAPRADFFQADDLHLNAAGYELWRERVGTALARWSQARSSAAAAP